MSRLAIRAAAGGRAPDAGRGATPGGRRGPRKRGRGPEMVPPAEFQSYYGRPVIKPPTWKSPDVPVYLFLGGTGGACAVMAALADATGRPALAHPARLAAAVGAAGGTVALIHDLGRPARFLNMLRVVRPTSPLNTGSWLLAGFATVAGAAAGSAVTGWLPWAGRSAGVVAALLGPAMMTYTAVLFADTAVPAWHEAYRELPFVFAGSALAGGAGMGLVSAPLPQAGPARTLAVVGPALELAAERAVRRRLGILAEPYHQGRAGRWRRASRLLSVAGAMTAVAGRRSRVASAVAGACLLAGSLCARFAAFNAGTASAADPKYTVLPQRQRLAAGAPSQ